MAFCNWTRARRWITHWHSRVHHLIGNGEKKWICFFSSHSSTSISIFSETAWFVFYLLFVPLLAMALVQYRSTKWNGIHKYLQVLNGMQTFGANENVITNNNDRARGKNTMNECDMTRHDRQLARNKYNSFCSIEEDELQRMMETGKCQINFIKNNENWCGFA